MKTNIFRTGHKFNRIYALIFIVIIAAVGYAILYQSRAAQDTTPPAVYLLPDAQTYPANTEFTVTVRENSGTTGINTVGAYLTYPTNLVDFVSIDSTGSAFTIEPTSTGGNGQVSIERGVQPVNGVGVALTGDQLIARVTFRTKLAAGSGDIAFAANSELLTADTNTNLIGSATAKRGMRLTVDNIAPSVSITNPTANLSISRGSTVPINMSVSDVSPISKVEVLIDGAIRATLTTAPYTYSWNTTGLSLGSHTIQARATDSIGNVGPSGTTTVNLVDNTAPSVSITSPVAGASVAGTIAVNATASDGTNGTGISKVEFYVGTTLIGSDATSPYSVSWNTTTVTDGSRALTARAYDGATPVNSQPSAAVTVNVSNDDTQPPTTPSNFRVSASTVNTISLAWNASTDNRGVTGYRISRGGTTLATVTGTTYTATGLQGSSSYTFTIVALDAAGNASPAATTTGGTQQPKVGDFNNDGLVNLQDLSELLSKWKTTDTKTDLNKNGLVDLYDLSIFLTNYGK